MFGSAADAACGHTRRHRESIERKNKKLFWFLFSFVLILHPFLRSRIVCVRARSDNNNDYYIMFDTDDRQFSKTSHAPRTYVIHFCVCVTLVSYIYGIHDVLRESCTVVQFRYPRFARRHSPLRSIQGEKM